ncbi:MAG: tRNA pseudouridine(54/55) synthase Pus10 [Candidatus Nanohaloarchaea archaeon]|nr:tRNA pseudouridine(54/55) synthase Pus10 [Candidatus Nanohaloarchaea archaeon]
MDITEKAEALSGLELCDHCFGRQFARLGHGLENFERALIIEEMLEEGEEIEEEDIDPEAVPDREVDRSESCKICRGLFQELDHFADLAMNALGRYELRTYLAGTRPPSEVVEAEEELWEEYGLQWVEPIKSELNRLIGKEVEERLEEERGIDTTVDFERPDVNFIVDMDKDRVELQINSMLIHGFYNKLERGIPQTEWPCGNCRGKGCDDCDWTGKQYQESVQELIAEPLIEATEGLETKFHGAGREDVDARCLGKREFVIELLEPQKRDIDLEELQEEINDRFEGKVQVFNLEFCEKDIVEDVKSRRSDKTYRALVELSEEVSEDDLEGLSGLKGTVEQKTPTRVDHRRASKTRKRKVLDVSWEKKGEKELELEVKGEAGLYVKELISGDKSKTKPSVSQILDTEAECKELDVVDIEKPEGYKDI